MMLSNIQNFTVIWKHLRDFQTVPLQHTHTHTDQKCLSSCQHVKEINMTSFQGNVSHAFKTRCDLSDLSELGYFVQNETFRLRK